jgi:TDG/mug DNA glycosylase family protein
MILGKPNRAQVLAARGKTIPDVIAPGLRVLFCGINPSLYSAAVGHHFARPGNRFWPALHAAGFTDRLLAPGEQRLLLEHGYGITNLVDAATASADELTPAALKAGATRLRRKLRRQRPACLAFLGITAYRQAFGPAQAALGLQPGAIAGSRVWVLPNPSGLNAHFQVADLALLFQQLRRDMIGECDPSRAPARGLQR